MTSTDPPANGPDWAAIRHAWEQTDTPVSGIAKAFHVHHLIVYQRAKSRKWAPHPAPHSQPTEPAAAIPAKPLPKPKSKPKRPVAKHRRPPKRASARRAPPSERHGQSIFATHRGAQNFIDGISATLMAKVSLHEAQIASLADMSPQDAERFDRSMRMMMQNFEKVLTLDADNNRPDDRAPAFDPATGAATTAGTGTTITPPQTRGIDPVDIQRGELARRIRSLHEQWLARRGTAAANTLGSGPAQHAALPGLADGSPPGAAPPAAH